MQVIEAILWIAAGVLAVPCAVFFAECVAALLPRTIHDEAANDARFAVVMPAHDEELVIEQTIRGLLPQITGRDRLLVVADNCTDRTTELARAAGAEVVERRDPERRGKGYALDCGVKHLASDPPDVVIFIDADCDVREGALARLAQLAKSTRRPVQAVYLMDLPPAPRSRDIVSALAFLVKNQVRPLGLWALGLPCHLTGTGMAWPWEAVAAVPLATGAIVEDMQLGLDLAVAGYPPLLAPDARVTGRLPQSAPAATTQRTRWEHGHIKTLLSSVPRLLGQALRQRRVDLLALALDLSVPPLSLLVVALLAGLGSAAVAAVFGASWGPLWVIAAAMGMVASAVAIAWARFARFLPAAGLLAAPFYVLWKLPIYLAFITHRQVRWVRTARDSTHSPRP